MSTQLLIFKNLSFLENFTIRPILFNIIGEVILLSETSRVSIRLELEKSNILSKSKKRSSTNLQAFAFKVLSVFWFFNTSLIMSGCTISRWLMSRTVM